MRTRVLLWAGLSLLLLASGFAAAQSFSIWIPGESVALPAPPPSTTATAMSPNGNATIVWTTADPGGEVQAVYRDATGTWSAAERLVTPNPFTSVYYPVVAMDADGRAACVWIQFFDWETNGTWPVDAYVNRYIPGSGWQGAEFIGRVGNATVFPASIAFGRAGEIFVTWVDSVTFGSTAVRVRSYQPIVGWSLDTMLDSNTTTLWPTNPVVAADASGTALVGWSLIDKDGSPIEARASTGSAGSGWEVAVNLDSGWGYALLHDAAVAGGSPVVIFAEYDGAGLQAQFVSRSYSKAGGWGTPAVVDPANIGPREAKLVGDPSGTLLSIHSKRIAGIVSVNGSTFTPGSGWRAWGLIESGDLNASQLTLASDGNGGAVGSWLGSNGTATYVGASRFRPIFFFGWEEAGIINYQEAPATFPSVGASRDSAVVAYIENGLYVMAAQFWRDNEAPGLTLTAPSAPYIKSHDVRIEGTTTEGATILAAGQTAYPDVFTGAFVVNLNLSDGPHVIAVTAYDYEGNAAISSVAFTVDTVSLLVLTSPSSVVTGSAMVAITGQAEPGSVVLVDGIPAAVSGNGAFVGVFNSPPGQTQVEVRAVDPAGNVNTTSVSIEFLDPAVAIFALEQALAAAQANASAAAANLSAAEARLDALEADAVATEAELAAARANVTIARSAADSASLQVQLAQADMAAAQQAAAAAQARADAAEKSAAGAGTLALLGIVLGAAGAGIGVLALARSGGTHVREKANRTRSASISSGQDEASDLRVKEKGNRTKALEEGGAPEADEADDLRGKEKGNRTK